MARAGTILLATIAQLAASAGCGTRCPQPLAIPRITDEWKLLRPGVYKIAFHFTTVEFHGSTVDRKRQVVSGLLHLKRMTEAMVRRYPLPRDKSFVKVLFYGAIEIDHKKLGPPQRGGLRLCRTEWETCEDYPAPTSCDPARAGVRISFIPSHGTLDISIGSSGNDLIRGGVLDGWGEIMVITDVYEGGFRGLRSETRGMPIEEGADYFCAVSTKLDKGDRDLCR